MGSGRKCAAVLGFLGLAGETRDYCQQQAGAWQRQQHPQYSSGGVATSHSKVRASDEDGYLEGRPWWYAERDIDRRAAEFIDRVHRGITVSSTDSSSMQY